MDMAERIQRASVLDCGFAYLDAVGLPFLGWPLPTMPFDPAAWLGHVVTAVAHAPVCQRTEEQAIADLRRIDNMGVRRALAKLDRNAAHDAPDGPHGAEGAAHD
jgi:predicted RNA polymerase sigma factor